MTIEAAVQQPHFGPKRLIVLIGLMYMYMPLSLDMYLPALPTMGQVFHTSEALVNLTLSLFMIFYTVGILIFGPISDKYGRKSSLSAGLLLYILGSAGCALSGSIYMLLACRVLQAIGGGCAAAISVALVKDCFPAAARSHVLAAIQCLSFLGPLCAPIIGGQVVKHATWRLTFWILAGFALVNLLLLLPLKEPLAKDARLQGSLLHSFSRLLVVAKNPGFLVPLIIISLFFAPYMAYVALSSYIYVNYFSLNPQIYSYFFAINSFFAIIAPILFVKLAKHVALRRLVLCVFAGGLLMGLLHCGLSWRAPALFLLCLVPYTMMENGIRPLTNDLLLSQQEGDTGSASALMNAVSNGICSVGMMLGGLGFSNPVQGFGLILAGCSVLSIVGWVGLSRSKLTVKGL